MKILFITDKYSPIVCGVGDYTQYLSSEFTKDGHEINVICSAEYEIIEHVRQNQLNNKVYPIVKNWNLKGYLKVLKQIKKLNPDWVLLQYVPHAFSKKGLPFMICLFLLVLKSYNLKIGITFHEVAVRLNKNIFHLILGISERFIANFMCLLANKVITSIALYASYLKFFQKKLSIIPIGSNIGKQEHDLSKYQELTLSYFGSNPRGLFKIPEMLDHLKKCGLIVNFIFIGKLKKNYQETFLERIEKLGLEKSKILFTGFVTPQKALEYLSKSTFYLGIFENGISLKSGSIAAAFAAGTPIIGTHGDMTDSYFFKDKINCLLIKNKEGILINDVVDNVRKFHIDKKSYKKLTDNVLKDYETHLSWEAISKKYQMLLK